MTTPRYAGDAAREPHPVKSRNRHLTAPLTPAQRISGCKINSVAPRRLGDKLLQRTATNEFPR